MTRFPVDGTGRLSSEREHPTADLVGPAGGDLTGNFPNPTITTVNGHAANSVVSTGSAPGNRLAVSQEAPLNIEWPEYGADGTGVADATSAIQAAINALPQSPSQGYGGTILCPRHYTCSGQLVLDNIAGVTLEGVAYQGGYPSIDRSLIKFTGLGVGANNSHITAQSSAAIALRNLGLRYTNASYVGKMIDFSHSPTPIDSGQLLIDGCEIGGYGGVFGAHSLLYMDKAIIWSVQNSYLHYAQRAIYGKTDGSYSNAVNIANCAFDNTPVSALSNGGEQWSVINCTFEGTEGVTGSGMAAAYKDETLGNSASSVLIMGCWMGDAVKINSWVNVPFLSAGPAALTMIGNTIQGAGHDGSSGVITFKATGEFVAIGNMAMSGPFDGIDLNAAGAPNNLDVCVIIGNHFDVAGTPITGLSVQQHAVAFGNSNPGNPDPIDRITISDQFVTGNSGNTPTVAAGAASGAGATVGIVGNNVAGVVHVVAGTGAAAGQQIEIDFGASTPFTSPNTPSTGPKVFITAGGAGSDARDAAALVPSIYSPAANKAIIQTSNAPTAAQTYYYQYFAVQ